MGKRVTLDTQVEDLVRDHPSTAGFLTAQGVRCIRCGEPVWGTLGELLEEESVEEPNSLVEKLNKYLENAE